MYTTQRNTTIKCIVSNTIYISTYRHAFKSFGRASGIEKSVLDALQGHKGREVSLDYGKDEFGAVYALKTLSEALERIEAFRDL